MSLRFALAAAIFLGGATVAAAKPSVVLILADDLGWRDLGVTGSEVYQTPHIDRLFASGVRFEPSYSSSQVCSPTRASLLTGKAPPRHGITEWIGAKAGEPWTRNTPVVPPTYVQALPHEDVTLAEALGSAGYRCHFSGKWHLGGVGSLPTDHGFDVNVGGHHRGSPPGGYFSPYANPLLEDGPPGEYLPLRLARETAAFIEEETGPYFALLSFHVVHGPLQTTRKRWDANRRELLDRPPPTRRFAFDRAMPVRQTQDNPAYAGMVEAMDDAVGIVLAALERSGRRDDTIVIFTSDNGGVSSGDHRGTSNLPLRGGKGRQFEGGRRVPLAIAFPSDLPAGHQVADPVITADLYPTVLELCGLPKTPEQHCDGVSLVDAMTGGRLAPRRLFWHYPHYSNQGGEPSSVVLDDGWKLIHYHEDGRDELYHLPTDVGEQHDLADEQGDRVAQLGAALAAWLDETGAKTPTVNPRFNAADRARALRRSRTQGLRQEEANAAGYLRPNWNPGADWWGSEPAG